MTIIDCYEYGLILGSRVREVDECAFEYSSVSWGGGGWNKYGGCRITGAVDGCIVGIAVTVLCVYKKSECRLSLKSTMRLT